MNFFRIKKQSILNIQPKRKIELVKSSIGLKYGTEFGTILAGDLLIHEDWNYVIKIACIQVVHTPFICSSTAKPASP